MKQIILTQEQINHKIRRIAYQIYETHADEQEVILAGIAGNGYIFAEKLAAMLKEISSLEIKLCEVKIIPFQFRQLMHNLISNALKFKHPEHDPKIVIKGEIGKGSAFHLDSLQQRKKYCHITVTDNGIGFNSDYAEKIFEVFQRLHGKEEYEGTGIGLAIVKKIVENHQGYIEAHGEPEKGATFDIYLPAV